MSFGLGFALPAYPLRGGGGNNPFNQSGPTLDLSFAGVVTDQLDPNGYTLNTNFITPQYQIAAQYVIWENGVGLVAESFSNIITFTRASTGSYFDASGTLQSAAIDAPRFDYDPSTLAAQGLLIEEARTNSIRNNTMQGAVAGTPGTAPTNWDVVVSGSGITREVVGTGTEDGITYVDLRFYGTGSGNATPQIRPETTTSIVSAVGQTWTASYYLRIVGGSTTGITSWAQIWQERDAAGVALTTAIAAVSSPTTAALKTQRSVTTRTLTDAAAVWLTNRIQWAFVDGVPVDLTLRIGLPQLELGAFATSVIPTSTSTAAVTRSADVASVNTLSPWYNQTEGSWVAEASVLGSNANALAVWNNPILKVTEAADNSLFGECLLFGTSAAPKRVQYASRDSVANAAVFFSPGVVPDTPYKFAGARADGSTISIGYAGQALSSTLTSTLPTRTRLFIGRGVTGSVLNAPAADSMYLNGHIRRITYYPRRLSNAELVSITS